MKGKTLGLFALAAGVVLYLKNKASGTNGNGNGNGDTPGDVVYLWAKDWFGIVGIHRIQNKATGAIVANVQYDQDVFALQSGVTYQYTSTGNYQADLKTTWGTWPEKPVNTRAVTFQLLSGQLSGNIAGVAFEFKLI